MVASGSDISIVTESLFSIFFLFYHLQAHEDFRMYQPIQSSDIDVYS